jgi:phosphate transport system substrate-binding protein
MMDYRKDPAIPLKRRWLAAMPLCMAALTALPSAPVHAQAVKLSETGSTLLYPLFNTWVAAYTKAHPDVQINVGATGSESGIQQAVAGKVLIGASDAYMSDADAMQHPQILNIPLAIAAQTVNYNLPGLNAIHLKLDGPVLAGIYTGAIREWDAAPIAALNPGVSLPHHAIVPRVPATHSSSPSTSRSRRLRGKTTRDSAPPSHGLPCRVALQRREMPACCSRSSRPPIQSATWV